MRGRCAPRGERDDTTTTPPSLALSGRMSSLRDLLRFVPCRFRTGVMDVVLDGPRDRYEARLTDLRGLADFEIMDAE